MTTTSEPPSTTTTTTQAPATTTTTTTTQPPATTTEAPQIVTISTLDSAFGNLWWPSLAVAPDGNPGVSYRHPDGVKFASCTDVVCTSAVLAVIDSTAGGAGGTSLVYGSQGHPIVAYRHHSETGLRLATCTSECTHPQVTYLIDNGYQLSTGNYPAVALKSDGVPVIGHLYGSGGQARIAICIQPDCSWFNNGNNGNGIVTADYDAAGVVAAGNTVYGPLLVYARPLVSGPNTLRVAQCVNASCSSWNFSDVASIGSTSNAYPSVAVNNSGMPVIAYYDRDDMDLKVVACSSQNCYPGIGNSAGSSQLVSVVDSSGDVGTNSSIAIQGNNNPVIAYYDITSGALKVAECTTPSCSSSIIKTIGPADDSGRMSIAIGNDGTPLVAYIDNNSLKIARVPIG